MSQFNLNDDDVIHIDSGSGLVGAPTFRVVQTKRRIAEATHCLGPNIERWAKDGVRCEILRPGENWRRGKVRLQVEFIPDEPDEPSDPNQSDAVLSPNPQS